ncbi:MAG: Zn-ribbon domain-containing OB-fold protein [Archaeoglobus sp.]|nr:Zn-ribbon domain-containing OB-fold protein [Archaeoglobus sp.]
MRTIKLPDSVELPTLLDPFDQQEPSGPDATGIYDFYRNLAEGDLTTTKCKDCGKLNFPPVIVCPNCLSDNLEWVRIPEVGELYAFSVMALGVPAIIDGYAPFVVAIARFGNYPDEGIQISGIIFDSKYEELKIGDKVKWEIVEIQGPGEKKRYWYCFRKI